MKNLKYSCIILYVIFPFLANSQLDLTHKAYEQLKNSPSLENAIVSFSVQSISDSDLNYYSEHSHIAVRPASTLKVLTTWIAQERLGPDYKYRTEIHYSGSVVNKTLKGDLYIIGGGDPSLGSSSFAHAKPLNTLLGDVSSAISELGIQHIEGKVLAVKPKMEEEEVPVSWSWENIGNYYGAHHNDLNIHENMYFFHMQRRNREGSMIQNYSVSPKSPILDFVDVSVREAGRYSGDNAYIFGSPFTAQRNVRGTIPTGNSTFTIKGSLPMPGAHFAYWIKEKLAKNNISTKGYRTVSAMPEGTKVLFTEESARLSKLIQHTNTESNNLYAEAMLKEIGFISSGKRTREAGLKEINDFLKARGLNEENFDLHDGSGLSAQNLIVPADYTRFLSKIMKDSDGEEFYNLLPQFGKDGTLKYILNDGQSAAQNMRGKSGSISGVLAYVGYFQLENDETYAFSLFIDHWHKGSYSLVKRKIEFLLQECFNELQSLE